MKTHPITPAEFEQSLRSSPKALVMILLLAVGARALGPGPGFLLGYFIILPNLAMALGLGVFQEEYEKGHLRYFWGWPIGRTTLWLVKLVSALTFLIVIAGCVGLVQALWPTGAIAPPPREVMLGPIGPVGPNTMLWLIGSLALFALASGMVGMGACRSAKHATFICLPLIYMPIALVFTFMLWFDIVPTAGVVATMFTAAAVVLLIGAYVLFRLRNPFLEQVWVWRGVAALTAATAIGAAALGLPLAMLTGGGLSRAMARGVTMFEVDPAGPWVYVTLSDMRHNHLAVLDGEGGWVAYLGKDQGWLPWGMSRHPDGSLLTEQMTLGPINAQRRALFLHPPSGPPRVIFEDDEFDNANRTVFSIQWVAASNDGSVLYGTEISFDVDSQTQQHMLIALDTDTGRLRRAPLTTDQISVFGVLPDGRVVADMQPQQPYNADYSSSELVLLDPWQNKTTPIELPEDTIEVVLFKDGSALIALVQTIDGNRVSYRVVRIGLPGLESTEMTADPPLPSLPLQALLSRGVPSIGAGQDWQTGGALLTHRAYGTDNPTRYWLLPPGEKQWIGLTAEQNTYSVPFLSPNRELWAAFVRDWTSTSPNLELHVMRRARDGGRPEMVLRQPVKFAMQQPQWLDNDRVLYLHNESSNPAAPKTRLRVLNVRTGEDTAFTVMDPALLAETTDR